ncbi:MAG TPA: ABC transporter permease [Acidimicrobiia bacterium]|nr:ABC transporter permease [Acidimicrobiia bacterium]
MLRRYVAARLVAGLFGLLLFLTVIFFLTRIMVPGDFSTNFAVGSGGAFAGLAERLGLNRPLWQQYLLWLGGVLTLDLGRSPGGPPVLQIVLAALPWTLTMFVLGLGTAFWVGSRVGRWAGWRRRFTTPTSLGAATLSSIFPPWLVFLFFYMTVNLFGFRWFNTVTALDYYLWEVVREHRVLWTMLATLFGPLALSLGVERLISDRRRRRIWRYSSRAAIPLFALWAWDQAGISAHAFDLLGILMLPIVVLFLLSVGDVILVVAAAVEGSHESDFVTTARAKGLTDRQVRERHAGRVALLPALSRLTATLPFALGGLVIIEGSFGRLGGYRIDLPGVASVLFGSLRQRNFLVTMGGLIVVGMITLVVRIILDLAAASLDPRIQLERATYG